MRTLLFVVLVLMSVAAPAATDIRTVSAEATGVDREQAIYNALGEAVRQVRGAQISASRQVQSALKRMSTRTEDGRESTTTMSSAQQSSTRVSSSGLISGYRIVSVTNAAGGGKLARLKVDIPVYTVPGSSAQDNRWRMAVYPVETARHRYSVDGQGFSADEVSQRMTHAISDALTRSRRFAMLARDGESAMVAERQRMTGRDVPVAEKAMLGNVLGAEYLVTARVTELSLGSEAQTSRLTGETTRRSTGSAALELRVVVPATGSIVWSQTLNANAASLGLELTGDSHSAQAAFDQIGREVALRVVDAVWPPLVEKQEGDELVINMGGNLLSPGEVWEVFALGSAVRNSHTGSALGRQEQRVASIKINRSTDKMSYAIVVDGRVKGTGHVVRRSARPQRAESAADAVRGTRKRTCLPMDPC
ncbi:CsgG/HfaB family protein [Marinobacter sp. X15-166B]|uniref:CsgG/HfaB family protein n=1 Tax=Marinobacter sp. X15-166B TaxID=1897620 RepID=UPI0013014BA9|nr:CsgG/HfaB family protein [Marinobacter sp. X15-166B]